MIDRWDEVSRQFDALSELEPQARAMAMAALEITDPALAREVQRLLDADAAAGVLDAGFAASPSLLTKLGAPADDTLITTRQGKRVGHYRLLARVGSGGMGEVWRAERVDGEFEQQVAVKLIRGGLDAEELQRRFARERRILARLEHPNIARLLDGGVDADGTPYYAMEFVDGVNIVEFCTREKLGARARVELLLQVCDAVASAQAQLVVHRDIKPSNILVDGNGRVRVLDFGIARLLDETADARITATGMRVFSPAYAAPEQIRGDDIGTSVDVYALGAVLYELLTGSLPHPERPSAPDRLLSSLGQETVQPPSRRLRDAKAAVTTVPSARTSSTNARELQGDLDTIVVAALQPDPARRYLGAAQLADDLRRWLDGRPIAARPDTAGYRVARFVARHRFAVGSASGVLLALIAGLGLALWQAQVARTHAARADHEATRATQEAQRAESEAAQVRAQAARVKNVKDFMVSVFLAEDPMRRVGDAPPTLADAFDRSIVRAREELTGDPALQIDVLDDFGEIRANQGRFDDAVVLFDLALALAEKTYGKDSPVVAESLLNRGAVEDFRGHTDAAAPYLERAYAILQRDDGGDPMQLATAQSNISVLRRAQGRMDEMRPLLEASLATTRANVPAGDLRLAIPLTNLAVLDEHEGKLDVAEEHLREAMALVEAAQGKDSPNLWSMLGTLENVLYSRNKRDEADALVARRMQIIEANYPGDHPWRASTLVSLGDVDARNDRAEQGEARMREAIAMYERLESPDLVDAQRRLAQSQFRRGDKQAAFDTFTQTLAGCDKRDGARDVLCIVSRVDRAKVLVALERPAEALTEAEASLTLLDAIDASPDERAQGLEARARALGALKRNAEARATYDTAIALRTEYYGAEHDDTQKLVKARDKLQ